MMLIQSVLQPRQPFLKTQNCAVEKVVELSADEYTAFCHHLSDDYEFIRQNADVMYQDQSGIHHCLLVLGEGYHDGVLVEAKGYNYARYSAHVPDARRFWTMEQHPSLDVLCDKMVQLADKYAKLAVECQRDGIFRIDHHALEKGIDFAYYNEYLLVEMLSERPELEYVETVGDEIAMFIAPEYVRHEDESHYRKPTPQDVEIICAKHVLWLNDAGGEQADFSNCLLKDMDLSRRNLISAIFTGAKFVNADLRRAELCSAECSGIRFHNCDVSDAVAEEADFSGAEFISCELDRGIFTHSNFSDARFRDCSMSGGSLQNCCVEGAEFGDMPLASVNRIGCSYDEQEWIAEQSGSGISM